MDGHWVEAIAFPSRDRRAAHVPDESPRIISLSSRPRQISGVILEFAGVLYDDSAWQRWLLQQLARIGLQTHYAAFFRVFERDFLPDVQRGRDYWEALREFLIASGMSRGQIEEVEAAGRSQIKKFESNVRPLPGVASTIVQLYGQNIPLVILSNTQCTACELQQRLRFMGLADRFCAVLTSRDLGVRKPDSASYQAALQHLKLQADEVAYVGKSSEEIQGAAKLGLTTIAINHEPGTRADVLLDRFDQLLLAVELRANVKLAG